jgi:hypothetical protein
MSPSQLPILLCRLADSAECNDVIIGNSEESTVYTRGCNNFVRKAGRLGCIGYMKCSLTCIALVCHVIYIMGYLKYLPAYSDLKRSWFGRASLRVTLARHGAELAFPSSFSGYTPSRAPPSTNFRFTAVGHLCRLMGFFACCEALQSRFLYSSLPIPGYHPHYSLPPFPDPNFLASPSRCVCPPAVSRHPVFLASPLSDLRIPRRGVSFRGHHRSGSTSDCGFGRMGTPGRSPDSTKRVSPAPTTAKESVYTGKEKGHREEGGLNIAGKVRSRHLRHTERFTCLAHLPDAR